MPRNAHRHRRLQAQMNLVPYIDVMLVLLIIFMVTSPMMKFEGVDVELPEIAAQALDTDTQMPLLIKITQQGQYLLSDADNDYFDQPYGTDQLAELGAYILLISRQQPQRPIVLSGDQHVAYGKVLEFMAYLQGNGIKVRLMTRAPEQKKS